MALKRNDTFHKNIIDEIVIETNIDRRVVDIVATHPFLFISRVIRDTMDLKSIMVRYFGKFAIRNGSKKIQAQKELQQS